MIEKLETILLRLLPLWLLREKKFFQLDTLKRQWYDGKQNLCAINFYFYWSARSQSRIFLHQHSIVSAPALWCWMTAKVEWTARYHVSICSLQFWWCQEKILKWGAYWSSFLLLHCVLELTVFHFNSGYSLGYWLPVRTFFSVLEVFSRGWVVLALVCSHAHFWSNH